MISAAQEERMSAARAARDKQNKKIPLLINIEDGRLVPNVPLIGGRKEVRNADGHVIVAARLPHPKYRPYMGDPKATLAQRMTMLATQGIIGAMPVTDAPLSADEELAPIDIETAKPQEMIDYAMKKYHHEFEPGTHHNKMRALLRQLEAQNADLG